VTGIGTVLADDPALTVRLDSGDDVVQPTRVILDTGLRMPTTAKCLEAPGKTVIVTASTDRDRKQALADRGAEIATLEPGAGGSGVSLDGLARWLGASEFNEVLVEAGPTLNGALLRAGLVDSWLIYMAPCVLGSDGRALFELAGLSSMSERPELRFTDIRRVGPDLRLTLLPKKPQSGED
jgi:diaminohydroxyphosphoribosylaminopyrimidine deaminase/5-amino-6-(5-phosphoribosylamino)uracil reductase